MNHRSLSPLHILLVSAPLSLAMGATDCGLKVPDGIGIEGEGVASDTTEAEPTVAIASALSALPVLTLTSSDVTLADAVMKQAGVSAALANPTCLTVETAGNVVTYVMDNCRGPWGLITVSGSEVATFSSLGPASFQIDLQSQDLVVNGKSSTHSGSIVTTVHADGTRSIQWTGSYQGSTLLGRDVSFDTDVGVDLLDGGAVTLNGNVQLGIGLRNLDIEFDQLQRNGPKGTCPTGTMTVTTKLTQLTLTLTFDGTAKVFVESARGGHDTVDLTCTPAAGG